MARITAFAVWAICGDQDAFYTHTVNDVNNINAANPPIPAVLTTLPGVGHSGWVYAYNPDWTGNQLHTNIYDWMINYKKAKVRDFLVAGFGITIKLSLCPLLYGCTSIEQNSRST